MNIALLHQLLQPVVLGLVQGLTEFIPVSSSGHLVIVRNLLGWSDQGALFDAVLHLATVVAIVIYFRDDVMMMLRSLRPSAQSHNTTQNRKLLVLLAVATVPAILVGLLLTDLIEGQSRSLAIVASLMIFTGLMFVLVEKISVSRKSLSKLTFFDALGIGAAQAAALLPGISRSGSTIMAGMYFGLKREDAARYAFLLAIPALLLAGGYALFQMEVGQQAINWLELGVGAVVSLFSSLLAISFMMRFLKTNRLYGFAGYLIVIGVILLGLILAHVKLPLTL